MKVPNGRIEDLCSDVQGLVISDCRLERSKDANEPGIGRLIATNGKALAIVRVDLCDEDVDGQVSVPVIKLARKQPKSLRGRADSLVLNSGAKVTTKDGFVEMPRVATMTGRPFPDVDAVIPKKEEADVILTIDAELLYKLAEAISGDNEFHRHQVRLYLKTEKQKVGGHRTVSDGIYVERDVKNPASGFGVIMPCSQRN